MLGIKSLGHLMSQVITLYIIKVTVFIQLEFDHLNHAARSLATRFSINSGEIHYLIAVQWTEGLLDYTFLTNWLHVNSKQT
jgi:hypothetical protein